MKYASIAAAATVAATFASTAIADDTNQSYVGPVSQTSQGYAATGWTGGYLGGNLNYGTGRFTTSGDWATGLSSNGFPTVGKPDGASGAIRAGYDWQSGVGVFGVGAEYNLGKYKDSAVGPGGSLNTEIKSAAMIFARAGYAINENFMAYGLVGYTWSKGSASASGGGVNFDESRDLDGGTIGLGAEYKFNPNWSTYGEYTYTDFGTVENTQSRLKATLGQVKLGVNYRF